MVHQGCVRVTALASLKRTWDDLEMILSGDSNGTITLWDSSGGRCHFSRKVLRRPVSSIKILPSEISRNRDLILTFSRGMNQIEVVDVHSLATVAILSQQGPLTDIAVAEVEGTYVLLALAVAGTLGLWDLKEVVSGIQQRSGAANKSPRDFVLQPKAEVPLDRLLAPPPLKNPPPAPASAHPPPSPAGAPLDLTVSPNGTQLCVRFQGGYFSLLSLPSLFEIARSASQRRRSYKDTSSLASKCVLLRDASLESEEERRIRESEGTPSIGWIGSVYLSESELSSPEGTTLVFYAKDGSTRIARLSPSQSEDDERLKANIEEGPAVLKSQRKTLQRAARDIPTMSRHLTEDLAFERKQSKDNPHSIRGWSQCVALRIRAVGVGLREHLDRVSSSDTYLQVYSGDELLWETEVVHNSPNPHWKDIVLEKERLDAKRGVRFLVLDKDELLDERVGALELDLKTLTSMAKNCTLPLSPVGDSGEILEEKTPADIGSIRFKAVELETTEAGSNANYMSPSTLSPMPSAIHSPAAKITKGTITLKSADGKEGGTLGPGGGTLGPGGGTRDRFHAAAGARPGRPRELGALMSRNAPVRLCQSPDGTVVCAGGSGLLQIWTYLPPPPEEFSNLSREEQLSSFLEMLGEEKAKEEAEKKKDDAEKKSENNFAGLVKDKTLALLGNEDNKEKLFDTMVSLYDARGLMSPVFWIGDAFDALQSNPCTASVLAAGGGSGSSPVALLLARGHQNGEIVASSLLDGQKHVSFHGHRGEVTCIVAVPPEQSPTDSPLLVSGSLDGCVCVWDMAKQDRLGRFRCRSPVLSLHWPQAKEGVTRDTPEGGGESISGDLVMAVTADHAVHIVSLSHLDVVQVFQGHDSRVAAIYRNRWAVQADFIVTQTLSGTAYLWSLSTGHLERMIGRRDAYDFLLARGLLDPSAERTFLQASESDVKVTSSSQTTLPADAANTQSTVITSTPPLVGMPMTPSPQLTPSLPPPASLLSHKSTPDLKNKNSPKVPRAKTFTPTKDKPKSDKKKSSRRTSLRPSLDQKKQAPQEPLMQVCSMGRAGGVLRANMFCLNVNRLIQELRTQYRHLSSRAGGRGGATPTLQALLSYLFEWGVDPNIDTILKDHFGFRRPYPTPAFGVMSYRSKAVALLLPGASMGNSRWELCPTLTAIHSLSLSALCMTMLSATHPSKQVYYTQVVSHYGVHLPDHLQTYVEPSVEVLVVYSYNQTEEIHMASRLLLQGVIERSSLPTLRKIVERWTSEHYFSPKMEGGFNVKNRQALLPGEGFKAGSLSPYFETPVLSSDPTMDRRLIAALVLCLIAADQQRKRQKTRERAARKAEKGEDVKDVENDYKDQKDSAIKLTSSVVRQITETLLKVVFDVGSRHDTNDERPLSPQDIVVSSLAAELMGKGFFLWRRHVTDVASLISRLHRLSLIKRAALAGAAHRALLQAGQSAPRSFIRQMGNEALNLKSKARCRSGALFAIVALVKKYPSSLINALPSAVQIIIKCLDPSAPALRKSLLRPATAALHALVQNYPSVTFHQKSQRFAVGTTARTSSVIVIYDLRTATKWRILSGHKKTITAVSFNPSATYLASYSPDEEPASLKFWETGSQGFLTNFLGITCQCIKTVPLPGIQLAAPGAQLTSEALLNNRIVWISPKMVKLRREDGTVTNHSI
eukprot:CAMPEP_0167796704 /NCGR_PEP_ID=MMETSP0111_2-20121227/15207_1 /TAXON_ID=91324 /ORGANISM="Lotharella globosa, Strain CCCM811" /LENGTH=1669 /DNA_ID=CAMNT_0007690649 /DNA_START=264 /DNA_END=5273 /DNA_ORIENTATION=+